MVVPKKNKLGNLEPQALGISGSINEIPASSHSRSFERGLLMVYPEEGKNAALEHMESVPANDNQSPFWPIHPLRMCAPLVRSHVDFPNFSSVLKKKQTFASPRKPNPGILTPNPRHSLSRVLDHFFVRGEFSHLIFVFLIDSYVLQQD